jgi:hypothetical protein
LLLKILPKAIRPKSIRVPCLIGIGHVSVQSGGRDHEADIVGRFFTNYPFDFGRLRLPSPGKAYVQVRYHPSAFWLLHYQGDC